MGLPDSQRPPHGSEGLTEHEAVPEVTGALHLLPHSLLTTTPTMALVFGIKTAQVKFNKIIIPIILTD